MRRFGHTQYLLLHPLTRRIYWVVYAIFFYHSGLAFTIWAMEPHNFSGGTDWFWLALFPFLLPGFFLVNRYLGCATGQCTSDECYRTDDDTVK